MRQSENEVTSDNEVTGNTESVGSSNRKRRASKNRKKIQQAWTAIRTYHDPAVISHFKGMRGAMFEVLASMEPFTAREIQEDLKPLGYDVPESTVGGQLHGLFDIDVVTDYDTPDRPCRITGRTKKTWRLLTISERWETLVEKALIAGTESKGDGGDCTPVM